MSDMSGKMSDAVNAYKPAMQANAYIATDPVPEYPPRLPPDTRRQVVIDGKQIYELDRDGNVVKSYAYDAEMMR